MPADSPSSRQWNIDDWQTHASIVVFAVTWLLIAKRWTWMPIGRTAGALVGAVSMVGLGIVSPEVANSAIEMDTVLLLIGLMLILAHLESKGSVDLLANILTYGTSSPGTVLIRISLASGVLAAFIMNDGAALFLSLVVRRYCEQNRLPLTPYMIAMATSANIGSAATVLGNPKNMVIHVKARLDFVPFLRHLGPPAVVGLIMNTIFLRLYWHSTLREATAAHIDEKLHIVASDSQSVSRGDSDDDEEESEDDKSVRNGKEKEKEKALAKQDKAALQQQEKIISRGSHMRENSRSVLEFRDLMFGEGGGVGGGGGHLAAVAERESGSIEIDEYNNNSNNNNNNNKENHLNNRQHNERTPLLPPRGSPLRRQGSNTVGVLDPMPWGSSPHSLTRSLSHSFHPSSHHSSLSLTATNTITTTANNFNGVLTHTPNHRSQNYGGVSGRGAHITAAAQGAGSGSRSGSCSPIRQAHGLQGPPPHRPTFQQGQQPSALRYRRMHMDPFLFAQDKAKGQGRSRDRASSEYSSHCSGDGQQMPYYPTPPFTLVPFPPSRRLGLATMFDWDSLHPTTTQHEQPAVVSAPEDSWHENEDNENSGLLKKGKRAKTPPLPLPSTTTATATATTTTTATIPAVVKQSKNKTTIATDAVQPFWRIFATLFDVNVFVVLVLVMMYGLFLLNFDLGWTCLMCAVAIVILERTDPAPLLSKVNWPLLLYMIALFVTIKGINQTPISGWLWGLVAPLVKEGRSLPTSIFGFSLLVVLLCLMFTSIPCVLLVSPHLREMSGPLQGFGWLLLAWCVTLCGNLTIFGSVAGVIAADSCAGVEPISFWTWFRYSFPTTLLITALGASILAYSATHSQDGLAHSQLIP